MVATYAFFLASRPVHVLHVIGLVGAGKTRFFREYFPTLPVFDIQTVYQQQEFSPEDLKTDPRAYRQFADALNLAWNEFIDLHDPKNTLPGSFCVGVESSGINQALNVLLVQTFPTVLWIDGDPPPASDTVFWKIRPYGPALNTVLQSKWNAKAIHYTHLFNPRTHQFSATLPADFIALSPRLTSPQVNTTQFLVRKFRCPICQIPFSTEALFTRHLQRHQTDSSPSK